MAETGRTEHLSALQPVWWAEKTTPPKDMAHTNHGQSPITYGRRHYVLTAQNCFVPYSSASGSFRHIHTCALCSIRQK